MPSGKKTISTDAVMQMTDITTGLEQAIASTHIQEGIVYVYTPHTTTGITINEGADPDVQKDLIAAFKEIIPQNIAWRHAEGNSPAHLLATLVGSSVNVFISQGKLQLGTWQRIFFCEFDGPRQRTIHWKILAG